MTDTPSPSSTHTVLLRWLLAFGLMAVLLITGRQIKEYLARPNLVHCAENHDCLLEELSAQQGIWQATNLIAAFDLAMVVATFIGIWLLYCTLRETSKATAAAAAATDAATRTALAAENSSRAYIRIHVEASYSSNQNVQSEIDSTSIDSINISGRATGFFDVCVTFKNYGGTLADELQYAVVIGPTESGETTEWKRWGINLHNIMDFGSKVRDRWYKYEELLPHPMSYRVDSGKILSNKGESLLVPLRSISSETLFRGTAYLVVTWNYQDVFKRRRENRVWYKFLPLLVCSDDVEAWSDWHNQHGYSEEFMARYFADEIEVSKGFHMATND